MKIRVLLSGPVMTVLLLIVLSCPVLAEDGYNDYTISELGIDLSVPEDVDVLTRHMLADDPRFDDPELSADRLDDLLERSDQYFVGVGDGGEWELDIYAHDNGDRAVFEDDREDLSAYSDEYLTQFADEITASDPEHPLMLVYLDRQPFFLTQRQNDTYTADIYFSIVGDWEVWIEFLQKGDTIPDSSAVRWDDILSRITISKPESDIVRASKAKSIPVIYAPTGAGFTIELPADLYVLTYGMDEDDPALAFFYLDSEGVDDLLDRSGNCIDAVPPDLSWELCAQVHTDDDFAKMGDVALFSVEDFEAVFDADFSEEMSGSFDYAAEEILGGSVGSSRVLSEGTVRIGDYLFYRMEFDVEYDGFVFNRVTGYFTVYGGSAFTFGFSGEGLSREEQEAILSTVRFTVEPTGITELKRGSSIDWMNVVSKTLAGAVVGGIYGVIAGVKSRKKKRETDAAVERNDSGWRDDDAL